MAGHKRAVRIGIAAIAALAGVSAQGWLSPGVAIGLVPIVALDAWMEPRPTEIALADDIELAQDVSEKVGSDVTASAWADSATGLLTVGVADEATRQEVLDHLAAEGIASARVELVDHSEVQLEQVRASILATKTGPLATINSIAHDWENNRLLVTTAQGASDELRQALYDQFGDAVAVGDQPFEIQTVDRRNDANPFYAGAASGYFGGPAHCTLGYSWIGATGKARMLTAGHCYRRGTVNDDVATNYVPTYAYWVGNMVDSTVDADGTVGTDGDLAIIDTTSTGIYAINREGEPRMWITATTATSVHSVDMWTADGTSVCYSGRVTGAQCGPIVDGGNGGYVVQDKDYTFTDSSSGDIYTHVALSTKGWGKCAQPGDSGSPVYIDTAGAGVAAHGIASAAGGGGADYYVGHYEPGYCSMVFTEIGQAYDHWGGYVETE